MASVPLSSARKRTCTPPPHWELHGLQSVQLPNLQASVPAAAPPALASHACVLHVRLSVAAPSQARPPCCAGRSTVRARTCSPVAHGSEQSDHGPHSLHAQSTAHGCVLHGSSSSSTGHVLPPCVGCASTERTRRTTPPPHEAVHSSVSHSDTWQSRRHGWHTAAWTTLRSPSVCTAHASTWWPSTSVGTQSWYVSPSNLKGRMQGAPCVVLRSGAQKARSEADTMHHSRPPPSHWPVCAEQKGRTEHWPRSVSTPSEKVAHGRPSTVTRLLPTAGHVASASSSTWISHDSVLHACRSTSGSLHCSGSPSTSWRVRLRVPPPHSLSHGAQALQEP
mmetsp:Transcript_20016/g.63750  ORF Transcript_20016/g.63750 Transcript_20016/m.63750 type:complete len:335 (-) Transcript_20016:2487-3491(-)